MAKPTENEADDKGDGENEGDEEAATAPKADQASHGGLSTASSHGGAEEKSVDKTTPAHDADKNVASSYPLRWPVEGSVVTRFGLRNGVNHDGIDIAVSAGTDVHAAAAGRVIFAARHGGYGNLVILRHDSGLVTIYAHNSINLVRRGDHVTAGQVVARVGPGAHSGDAQLHFEVREGVKAANPMKFLPP